MISDRRLAKIQRVVANRQQMTVVLENVHDKHNIGAVMRTCDSVGIQELYVVYTDGRLDEEHFEAGKTSASSARKWLITHFFSDLESCMEAVKKKYDKIYATHLGHESKSIYRMDFTESIAFVFGNEKDGITEEMMQHVDQNIIIPQVGMIESLNISVACAISLYEAKRQRIEADLYGHDFDENNPSHAGGLAHFIKINDLRYEHRRS